jgi:hypothetical protein
MQCFGSLEVFSCEYFCGKTSYFDSNASKATNIQNIRSGVFVVII